MIKDILYFLFFAIAVFLLFANSTIFPDWLFWHKTAIAIIILFLINIFAQGEIIEYIEDTERRDRYKLEKHDEKFEEYKTEIKLINEDLKYFSRRFDEVEKRFERVDATINEFVRFLPQDKIFKEELK